MFCFGSPSFVRFFVCLCLCDLSSNSQMAAEETPVYGQRMHWHLQPAVPQYEENNDLKNFNKVFACWGTAEQQGASDQILLPQGKLFIYISQNHFGYFSSLAMIFLSDKLKTYILAPPDSEFQDLCPVCFCDVGQDLRYFCSENSMKYMPDYTPVSVFFDCGHLFCSSCANSIFTADQTCPLCRQERVTIRQIREVIRSPSLQANILRSLNSQLEPFHPTPAKTYQMQQWNWYSHDSWCVNFESLWSLKPVKGFFDAYSFELATHVQAAFELGFPVIVSTNVLNKPCYYYIDPHRQFQVSFKERLMEIFHL